MAYLISTFYIASIGTDRKVIIHRITESPAKAIQYRTQQIQRLKEQDGTEPDVRILRKSSRGDYVDVTGGGQSHD